MALVCSHGTRDHRVCTHVAGDDDVAFLLRFTGRGVEYVLACRECADVDAPMLVDVCAACFGSRERLVFDAEGVRGRPQVRSRPGGARFEHEMIHLASLAVDVHGPTALTDGSSSSWLAISRGALVRIDLERRCVDRLCELGADVGPPSAPLRIDVSPDGRFAGVVEARGRRGVVVDVLTGAITMRLDRGDYHEEHCEHSLAFFCDGARTLVVHATDWNRLEVSDAASGALLTPREPTRRVDAHSPRPAHYLDYFHAGLSVSPDGHWIVDDGWVWQPVGVLRRWDLRRWVHDNPWESEDGPSIVNLRVAGYLWDVPKRFADARTLVVWGFGPDADLMVDAALFFDLESCSLRRWFAGPPRGRFEIDGAHLVVVAGTDTTVWDLESGERVLEAPRFAPQAFHPSSHCHVSFGTDGVVTVSRLVTKGDGHAGQSCG